MPRHASCNASTAGLTLMEVMLSLAILVSAIVSVMGGLFSLHRWQQSEHEEAVAQRVVQTLAERVMGASWQSLGFADPSKPDGDPDKPMPDQPWSWHRREVPRLTRANGSPLDHYGTAWNTMTLPMAESVYATNNSPRYPPMTIGAQQASNDLIRLGLIDRGTAGSLTDLRVYLEYYAADALEVGGDTLILRGGRGQGVTHGGTIHWRVTYPARNVTVGQENLDRGLPEDADPASSDHFNPSQDPLTGLTNVQPLLVRIVATWTSLDGGPRRHETIFARRQ